MECGQWQRWEIGAGRSLGEILQFSANTTKSAGAELLTLTEEIGER